MAGGHNAEGETPRFTNRLAEESSPYLLQHKHNPVDWYPWGEEAFERARRENKPLLISIGYSACHWCHVMERESFEDPETARLMNEGFVCVKVDREERPDVDAIYMDACQAMTGQGGWPLNAFVTPDLKPFFVGTYFPPDMRYGRPSWRMVLERIREAWVTESRSLNAQADLLHDELNRMAEGSRHGSIDSDILQKCVNEAARNFDLRYGGFGDAPKFPPDTRLAMLLAAWHDHNSPSALEMVNRTLDGMAWGGMYDQIGGGFARYSVDAQWLIPHFEKMLYNQALLVPVYLDAYLLSKRDFYARTARETMDWVLREMTAPEGAFYSALDADSEGEEGKYYVWTPPQIEEILGGDDAALFCAYYGITARGNFEHGTSNPHVVTPPGEFAERHGMSEEQWLERLEPMKLKVREARRRRVPPGTDDKCLTSWNGLMITALCRGWQVLGDERYLAAARRSADFFLDRMRTPDGGLLRSFCKGRAVIEGVLDDYSYFIAGLIDLYESCFEIRYLEVARSLSDLMISRFGDREKGGFYFTAEGEKHLISRTRESHDGALPAGSSIAALSLVRLAAFFGREDYARVAQEAWESEGPRVNAMPQAFASLIIAWRFANGPSPQIVIAGPPASAEVRNLLEKTWRTYLPARVIALAQAPGADRLPLVEGKTATAGKPAAYVCHNFMCQAPVHTPEELSAQLK